MMAFLKTLLIILLVYFGLKFLIKLVTPYIMRYAAKKMGEKFEQAFGGNSGPAQPEKEGKISIEKIPKNKKSSGKKVGEYVDYEEIE